MTNETASQPEDAAAPPADLEEEDEARPLRWPRPWRREFWTIDTIYAAIGIALSTVSTVLIVYLSAGYDRQVHDLVGEQRHLNAVFRDGGRALFDMSAAAALERTFETHLQNVAEDDQRRRETGLALSLALGSFKTYLKILAPGALDAFTQQSDAWLKAFAAGDDAVPAAIRASIVRYINGPVADGNKARAARRMALKDEIAAARNARDLWRAVGAFFQIFGIILALCGQVAGRRMRARQFAPPEVRARLSTGVFNRHFWSIDVIAVVSGTVISLAGTIALYFLVVSYYHVIDETRGRLEERGIQVEVTEAAAHAYDDIGLMEPWVLDLTANRPESAFKPPDVPIQPMPGEDAAPREIGPEAYVRSRRSFAVYWFARVSRDDDPEKYAPIVDEYYRLYENLGDPRYAAFAERMRAEAAAKLAEIKAERQTLADRLSAEEGEQALVRDIGGIMQLLGLVLAFAGYVAYYKRPR